MALSGSPTPGMLPDVGDAAAPLCWVLAWPDPVPAVPPVSLWCPACPLTLGALHGDQAVQEGFDAGDTGQQDGVERGHPRLLALAQLQPQVADALQRLGRAHAARPPHPVAGGSPFWQPATVPVRGGMARWQPSFPGVLIPPWAPHPSPGFPSFPWVPMSPGGLHPSSLSPPLPGVPIPPRGHTPCWPPPPSSGFLSHPGPPHTLASSRSVRPVRGSACCSLRLKSFGVRTAGAKKRRKRNPLMEKYRTSWPGTGTAQGSGTWSWWRVDPQPRPCHLPHLVLC